MKQFITGSEKIDYLLAISIFTTVADEGGFSASARRLNMSPASVSRAVSQLESRLGVRLLTRTTRSVQLTDAGERYCADCQRILAELEEAERNAANTYWAPRGSVSITAPVLAGRMVISPILMRLLDVYQGISIVPVFLDRVVHLMDEGIDIAFRFGDLPDSSHIGVRVGSTRRVLCASPKYLESHGRPQTINDLDSHELIDLISMKHNGQWRLQNSGISVSYKPQSRIQVNNADVAISAAVEGRGIARVASYMISPQLVNGTLEIVLEDHEAPPAQAHLLRKETVQVPGRVRAVFDYMVEHLRNHPHLDP